MEVLRRTVYSRVANYFDGNAYSGLSLRRKFQERSGRSMSRVVARQRVALARARKSDSIDRKVYESLKRFRQERSQVNGAESIAVLKFATSIW